MVVFAVWFLIPCAGLNFTATLPCRPEEAAGYLAS